MSAYARSPPCTDPALPRPICPPQTMRRHLSIERRPLSTVPLDSLDLHLLSSLKIENTTCITAIMIQCALQTRS